MKKKTGFTVATYKDVPITPDAYISSGGTFDTLSEQRKLEILDKLITQATQLIAPAFSGLEFPETYELNYISINKHRKIICGMMTCLHWRANGRCAKQNKIIRDKDKYLKGHLYDTYSKCDIKEETTSLW